MNENGGAVGRTAGDPAIVNAGFHRKRLGRRQIVRCLPRVVASNQTPALRVSYSGRRAGVALALLLAVGTLVGACGAPGPVTSRQRGSSPDQLRRVGFLSQSIASQATDLPAFREGLVQEGLGEGHDLLLEVRYAEGDISRLPALAQELVQLPVAVIVATSSPAIQAARDATSTIPIVMGISADPVAQGFVRTLARPGGNVTGLTSISLPLSSKRLEVLKALAPSARRMAVLWDPTNSGKELEWEKLQETAVLLDLELLSLEATSAGDLPGAFDKAVQGEAQAVLNLGGPLLQRNHARIVELANEYRVPVMYETASLARAGGLVAYGPNTAELFKRSAYYVRRILDGDSPADLPVERPNRFYLTINLQAAQALGITFPHEIMLQVTEVVP